MNCIASTYNASGKLVGCNEQELNTIISVQLYTMFALGTGLYVCRSFTADQWADIAITIGWGCISAFTRTKRVFTKYALPYITLALKTIANEEYIDLPVNDAEESHSCIRVVKNGVETTYSSVFSFVKDLDERYTSAVDGDVINVEHSDTEEPDTEPKHQDNDTKPESDSEKHEDKDENEKEEEEEEEGESDDESEDESEDETDNENENDEGDDEHDDISELINRIKNHTMQFDFVLSEVPTLQTIVNALDPPTARSEGAHVMKYDGFPLDLTDGVHFYERKFVPVEHRMMEIVLQYEGAEYDLNLASPDNFYVAGNKLLDFAFLKWFMWKNHGIRLEINHEGSSGAKCDYIIKCVDHEAVLHTLCPHNYLHVSVAGFEVQDSGFV